MIHLSRYISVLIFGSDNTCVSVLPCHHDMLVRMRSLVPDSEDANLNLDIYWLCDIDMSPTSPLPSYLHLKNEINFSIMNDKSEIILLPTPEDFDVN